MDLSFVLNNMGITKDVIESGVSILVLMDLSFLQQIVKLQEDEDMIQFQSLFLWIFRSYMNRFESYVK